jgi:hypothetical protein
MNVAQIREQQQIRREYSAQIGSIIKNLSDPVPLQTLERLYDNIPAQMQTLFAQSELVRLTLNTDRRSTVRLALEESKYHAETIIVSGRPHPIRIFQHRHTLQQIILNWVRSYRITLPNKKAMTLDIYFGAKDIIPPKGRYISDGGLQASERVLDINDRQQTEQSLLKLKAIGQSGYYAVANRNFFEDRPLPSGTHFQRFILGPNTKQSLLRTACYLAKICDYNDWRVTTSIYRSLLQKWLYSLRNPNEAKSFQGASPTQYEINKFEDDPNANLDQNPRYERWIRGETDCHEQQKVLAHLNTGFFVGNPEEGLKVLVTPNLLGPFHILQQAVSLQSEEAHTQSKHHDKIKEAVKTLIPAQQSLRNNSQPAATNV